MKYRKAQGAEAKKEISFVMLPGTEIPFDELKKAEVGAPMTIKDILDNAEIEMTELCCILSSTLNALGGRSDFDGVDKLEDSMMSQACIIADLIKAAHKDAKAIKEALY